MARRELIPTKNEKVEQRVKNFRKEMAEYRQHFEKLKGERQDAEHALAHSDLLNCRGHSSATPENPYANALHARSSPFAPTPTTSGVSNISVSVEDHHFRERNFLSRTDTQLVTRFPWTPARRAVYSRP